MRGVAFSGIVECPTSYRNEINPIQVHIGRGPPTRASPRACPPAAASLQQTRACTTRRAPAAGSAERGRNRQRARCGGTRSRAGPGSALSCRWRTDRRFGQFRQEEEGGCAASGARTAKISCQAHRALTVSGGVLGTKGKALTRRPARPRASPAPPPARCARSPPCTSRLRSG